MKLWLDDWRLPPEGWTQAHSVNQAKELIMQTLFRSDPETWEDASLDNDLGQFFLDGGDGYKLLEWMIEHDRWPTNKPTIHSMNPVRAQYMTEDIERYWHD